MHNYIRYRLALNPEYIYSWSNSMLYTPPSREENPYIRDYTNADLDDFLHFWNDISEKHKKLPIFATVPQRKAPFDKTIKPAILVDPQMRDPSSLDYSVNIPSRNIVGAGIGHLLADEMGMHPEGSYILDDVLQDRPEKLAEFLNKKYNTGVSNYRFINPHNEGIAFNRNRILYQTLPHYWQKILEENPDNILEHLKTRNDDNELDSLLKDSVLQYAQKGYKLRLTRLWDRNIYTSSVSDYRNEPDMIRLPDDNNLNMNRALVNRLIHLHQGIPNLFEKRGHYYTQFLDSPEHINKPIIDSFDYIKYHFVPHLFGRSLGHLVGTHLNLLDDHEKLPHLHDLIEDYLNGDRHATELIKNFHDKYNVPMVAYSSPKDLREVIYPIYHANKLQKINNIDILQPVSAEDLHNHLVTESDDETPLETMLREDYAQRT